jgi:hypothetical protein
MKRLVLAAGLLVLTACESGPEEIPPMEPLFVTDDCALLNAVGRDQYKLSRDDAAMSVRLNGEDGPWTPGCDWKGMGFNLTQVSGPEGEAATAGQNRLTFSRPRYDTEGAFVRTSVTAGTDTTQALCRLEREGAGWTVKSCGPDPKLTKPRAPTPSPADQTPEGRPPVPIDPNVTARDAIIPSADPGDRPGGN